MKTVVIFAGGDPPPADVMHGLPREALVIAADSGFDHATSLGVPVDVLIGDLDSISSAGLENIGQSTRRGPNALPPTTVERHPVDKNASDLTLAIRGAVTRGAQRVIVIGGAGGRIDHLFTNSEVIASDEFSAATIEWLIGSAHIFVVRFHVEIEGRTGDIVTLLAHGGDAEGVVTTGLRWPLIDETLEQGSSRGLSNEMTGDVATVGVSSGIVLAFHVRDQDSASGAQ
jgi:thiamine pyrophosphokinase